MMHYHDFVLAHYGRDTFFWRSLSLTVYYDKRQPLAVMMYYYTSSLGTTAVIAHHLVITVSLSFSEGLLWYRAAVGRDGVLPRLCSIITSTSWILLWGSICLSLTVYYDTGQPLSVMMYYHNFVLGHYGRDLSFTLWRLTMIKDNRWPW